MAVWSHSIANDVKPELLQDMPDLEKSASIGTNGTTTHTDSITTATEQSDESNAEAATEQKIETKQRTSNGELWTK